MTDKLPPNATLDAVREFVASIAYAREELLDALTLTLAVTHTAPSVFTTKPRFLVTAKMPASGKSTLTLDIPLLLAHNPWQVGKSTSQPALMTKFTESTGVPTMLADDVGKIFGDSGTHGQTSPLYAIAIDGYRKTATVSMARSGVSRDFSSYGVMFMNGLHNAVPADLRTRAVCGEATPLPDGRQVRDSLDPSTELEGNALRSVLRQWVGQNSDDMQQFALNGLRKLHRKLNGRLRQVWGPLFAVAHVAGGDWPQRCMSAFVSLALDVSDRPQLTPDQQLVMDTAGIIRKHGLTAVFTADLIGELRKMEDRPLYTDTSDEYLTQVYLPRALGPSRNVRGTNLAGLSGQAKGRDSGPILARAEAVEAEFYPAPTADDYDPTDSELAFIPERMAIES